MILSEIPQPQRKIQFKVIAVASGIENWPLLCVFFKLLFCSEALGTCAVLPQARLCSGYLSHATAHRTCHCPHEVPTSGPGLKVRLSTLSPLNTSIPGSQGEKNISTELLHLCRAGTSTSWVLKEEKVHLNLQLLFKYLRI